MLSEAMSQEEKKAITALKHHIMRTSLDHLEGLDARTVFLLQKNKLLKNVHRVSVREDVDRILSNPQHPDRLPCDWGPFVFVRDNANRMGIIVVADLLIDNDPRLRNAALQYLSGGLSRLTSRTIETIEERRGQCSDTYDWLTACVLINDALRDDFFFNLAGIRQCLQQPYTDGLNQCLNSVLRPSLAMIGALKPTVWDPFEEQNEIRREIMACVEQATTLNEALERYYSRFGYLPLAASLSMPEVVRQWLDRHPLPDSVWNEVWTWADESIDPLKGYYAALTFLSRPDLIQFSESKRLWSTVTDIATQGDEIQSNSTKYGPSKLRCDLARHYCQYLECLLPCQDGERIASSSWWLSHQVVAVLPSMASMKQVYENSVRQYENVSHRVYALGHPQTKGSTLRYATLFFHSVWSLALLCQVGRNATSFERDSIPDIANSEITRKLSEYMMTGFPRAVLDRTNVYSFEDSITQSAVDWTAHVGTQADIEKITALATLHTQEITIPQLLEMTDNLVQYAPTVQMLVIRLLSLAAYMDHVPADELWNRLQKQEWRRLIIKNTDIDTLPLFCDLLIEVMVKANPEWSVYLPHLLVTEYLECSPDEKRQRCLMAFIIISSLSTGTVSGLERILHEIPVGTAHSIRMQWEGILKELAEFASPWIAGRIRCVLIALRSNG